MLLAGWPSSAVLQQPFPRHRRFAAQAQEMLKGIKDRIDAEEKLICLEGCDNSGTRMLSRAKISTSNRNMDRVWTISLRKIEKFVLDKLFQTDLMTDAALSFSILGILQMRNADWAVFTPAVRRTILLWSVKNSGIKKKTSGEWLMVFIKVAQKVIGSRSCPQFFQPKVNALTGLNRESFKPMKEDLDWMVKNVEKQPYVLAQLCH